MSATITVRVCRTRPLFGSVKPTASNSLKRPTPSPRPTAIPTTEARAPITRPSTTIENRTWRRDAPSVRRVGELARPLLDRDRERVRDHERADEQRDRAEREQEVLQEVEEALGVLRVRLRLLLRRSSPACRAAGWRGSRRRASPATRRAWPSRGSGRASRRARRAAAPSADRSPRASRRRGSPLLRSARGRRSSSGWSGRSPACRSSARPADPSCARSPGRSPPGSRPATFPSTSVSELSSGCVGSTLKPRFGAPP